MKKTFIIAIALIVLMSPVFAEGQIGLSLTPEWSWITSVNDFKAPANCGRTHFMITLDGANYFGKAGGFGIEYGLGMTIPVNQWQGDVIMNDTSSGAGIVFRAGVGYRYAFNDLIGIAAGVGLNGFYQPTSPINLPGSSKTSEFDLGLYGRVAVDFTLLKYLRINAGVATGGPVYTLLHASEMNISQSIRMGSIFLSPFIGVSYIY